MKKVAAMLIGALAATGAMAQSRPAVLDTSVVTQAVLVSAPLVVFSVVAVAAEDNNGSTSTAPTGPSSTAP